MGIRVNRYSVYVDDGDYSIEDIYQAIVDAGSSASAERTGDRSYYLDCNLYIGKNAPASLVMKGISLEFAGEFFQVYEGSLFQCGDKDSKGTHSGCYVRMENLRSTYGFGCKQRDGRYTRSGTLKLYASKIYAPCFWAWFNRPNEQVVEIENCIITGYGRISGDYSYLKNVTFLRGHKTYGSISTLGQILAMQDIRYERPVNNGYALYWAPSISGDCRIDDFICTKYDKFIRVVGRVSGEQFHLVDPLIDYDNLRSKFANRGATVVLNNTLTFFGGEDSDSISILYDGTEIDSFILSERRTSILPKAKIYDDDDVQFMGTYVVRVNSGEIEFEIESRRKQTVDLDIVRCKHSESADSIMLPSQQSYLGEPFTVFVRSKREPTVRIRKWDGSVMATAQTFALEPDFYRCEFMLGDLGEQGEDGVWQDGPHYITIDGKREHKAFMIEREDERCSTKSDISSLSGDDAASTSIYL